jgi:hypothetical protein
MNQSKPTAAEMLEIVGRALFEDEWAARLADVLKVRRDTLRKWRHGSLPIDATHPVFRELYALLRRRQGEVDLAEQQLRIWLARGPE